MLFCQSFFVNKRVSIATSAAFSLKNVVLKFCKQRFLVIITEAITFFLSNYRSINRAKKMQLVLCIFIQNIVNLTGTNTAIYIFRRFISVSTTLCMVALESLKFFLCVFVNI